MLLACDFHERVAIPRREDGVAGDLEVDLREHELVGVGERRRVDLGAADDEDALLVGEKRERVLERGGALGTLGAPRVVSRDDDVAPSGQRAEAIGERVPRAPAHHDRVPRRERLEVRDVLRQVPRDASVAPDHAIARDRGDERDRHTATGARIAGWCS